MSTPSLFDQTPPAHTLHRTTDPETSRDAARYVAPRLGSQQERILAIVEIHPGMTSREIGELYHETSGGDLEAPHKRLSELLRGGFVRRGDVRRCDITGRKAATWYGVTQ